MKLYVNMFGARVVGRILAQANRALVIAEESRRGVKRWIKNAKFLEEMLEPDDVLCCASECDIFGLGG